VLRSRCSLTASFPNRDSSGGECRDGCAPFIQFRAESFSASWCVGALIPDSCSRRSRNIRHRRRALLRVAGHSRERNPSIGDLPSLPPRNGRTRSLVIHLMCLQNSAPLACFGSVPTCGAILLQRRGRVAIQCGYPLVIILGCTIRAGASEVL
jgi:hypothetical protein